MDVWRLAAEHSLFAVVPVWFTLYMCYFAASHHSFAIDFHHAFWPAGRRVLDGLSPYAGPHSAAALSGVAFVYPAVGALLFAVLALIPHGVADILFVLASICGALGILRLLGVRDWRLYGLTLLWPPVISGWQTANVTLLLALGVAILWRLRDRPAVAGALTALLLSVKVFLWPLGLWLLVTRRFAAFAWMAASAVGMNLLAWLLLGEGRFHEYWTLVRTVTRVEQRTAYTVISLGLHLGVSQLVAYGVSFAIAGVALWSMFRSARRGNDCGALLMALGASLLTTPIVWRHYFALFLVPLAIARPRLNWIWAVPLLLFACPVTTPTLWQLLLSLGAMAIVVLELQLHPRVAARRDGARRVLSASLPLSVSGGRT